MSILIFAESDQGKLKKAPEVASYATALAEQQNSSVIALTFNVADASSLAQYGVVEILNISDTKLDNFNALAYAEALASAQLLKKEVKR